MNVETITMPVREAQEKLRAYRKQLHRRADDEYAAAARGYEELAKGRALLDVGNVMRTAPRDEKNRPRFAIARADRTQVCYRRRNDRDWFSTAANSWSWQQPEGLLRVFDVPLPNNVTIAEGFALVPMVPADVREDAGNPALSKCWILWEVEAWADRRIGARPDVDPFLMQHLGGSLYAILAAWDLSPLERAIMAGRAPRA